MTSAEFTESIAYEELEPDPAEVTMGLMAQLLALTANIHRDPAKRREPYDASDFLPKLPPDRQALDAKRKYDEAIRQMRANYVARGLGKH